MKDNENKSDTVAFVQPAHSKCYCLRYPQLFNKSKIITFCITEGIKLQKTITHYIKNTAHALKMWDSSIIQVNLTTTWKNPHIQKTILEGLSPSNLSCGQKLESQAPCNSFAPLTAPNGTMYALFAKRHSRELAYQNCYKRLFIF